MSSTSAPDASQLLKALQTVQRLAERRGILLRLVQRLSEPSATISEALLGGSPSILDLIPCDAAAVIDGTRLRQVGQTLPESQLRQLGLWVVQQCYARGHEPARPPASSAVPRRDEPTSNARADVGPTVPPALESGVATSQEAASLRDAGGHAGRRADMGDNQRRVAMRLPRGSDAASWTPLHRYSLQGPPEVLAPFLQHATLYHTDRLREAAPQLGELPDVLLALPLSPAGDGVFWFRAGGDERARQGLLSGQPGGNGFAQELPASEWAEEEIAAARELQEILAGAVLANARYLNQLRGRLSENADDQESFAYVASHDLKEPLRGIGNLSQFILEDYGDRLDEEGRRRLEMMIRLSRRMDTLINSLLHYTRVGRLELEISPVDLNELVAEAAELLEHRLREDGARLEVPRPLPTVRGDRTRLLEVLMNLIGNGLKYNDSPQKVVEVGYDADHPEVTVDRETGDKPVAIYVRDNGIGIDPRFHGEVFRIFKRLHTREAYGGGTGAGLSIVKRLVDRHGGRIWIQSQPGEGSTFWFTLRS